MFSKLFKRTPVPPANPVRVNRPVAPAKPEVSVPAPVVGRPAVVGGAAAPEEFVERRRVPRPLPVPEVIEGNGGDTDWALWEDVVRMQKAQDQESAKRIGSQPEDAGAAVGKSPT